MITFNCVFSKRIFIDYGIVTIILAMIIAAGIYVGITNGATIIVWVLGSWILFPLIGLFIINRRMHTSRIIIADDNNLIVHIFGYKDVVYPISEIASIEEIDFTDKKLKRKCYWSYPVAIGRGGNILPDQGVIIRFNRHWYKSSIPVFLNPDDSERFIQAIKARL